MATKFVFVTGGVTSSLGKGITAASVGLLLASCAILSWDEASLTSLTL